MNLGHWLKSTSKKLGANGVGTARLDALVLLEDATGKDRSWLLAHPEFELSDKQVKKLGTWVDRRANHEPLAYVRGKTEFYGREFLINKDVLEPRPESETMIDQLKRLKLPERPYIIDVGTGSGALAITAKLELPKAQVAGTEIDPKCLKIAEQNAKKHEVDVRFYEGNLLEPIETKPDVLLANLPYVPDDHQINEAAMNEPRIAIFGGLDGLDLYRRLFEQIEAFTRLKSGKILAGKQKPSYVLTESLPFQHHELVKIAQAHGYHQQTEDDFIQVFQPSDL